MLVMRGITGSGKTYNARLLVDQFLRLSSHQARAQSIKSNQSTPQLLDSFGNSKKLLNANASRQGRWLELHFNERGHIDSAKVLAFALDKSRLTRLTHEERTFHIFYQFLAASAAPQEQDHFALEDPSDYTLLASSGCANMLPSFGSPAVSVSSPTSNFCLFGLS